MERESIYVVTYGNQWKVTCEHCKSAFFETQAAAIKEAKRHVVALGKGVLSQIRVQGSNSEWRNEWTYGKDPFPPRG